MPLLPWRRRTRGRDTRLGPTKVRVLAMIAGGVLSAWPVAALASPPRPPWQPGDPYSPITQPASPEVLEISHVFWIILGISGVIFAGVVAAVILSILRYSHRPGDPQEPTQVFGNRRVEIIWTIIPTILLGFAFIITVKAMQDINSASPTSHGALFDVNAVGHQWWWEFQYPQYNFVTADEVHVPTGAYVHFHVESYDVIHSFWTPQLQRQIDANPGIDDAVYLSANKPGVYSGECYEYCGEGHAWMKYKEVVQTPVQFMAWVKHEQQKAATPVTAAQKAGKKIFFSNTCVNCHSISGTTAGGAVGPNLTHLASRWTVGAGAAQMTQTALEQWVHDPNTFKPGVVMPGYPFLSHKDLHNLASYLLSLK